jgi:pilus assembly protein Flp/PilA
MKKSLASFLRDESALTMVEYAVAGTLITLSAVTAFTLLGDSVWLHINLIAAALGFGI